MEKQIIKRRGIQFWHDEWCGQSNLKNLYPSLYVFDKRPYAFIADNFQLLGGYVVWDLHFLRSLKDNEVVEPKQYADSLGDELSFFRWNG